jgi:hypothetical protein
MVTAAMRSVFRESVCSFLQRARKVRADARVDAVDDRFFSVPNLCSNFCCVRRCGVVIIHAVDEALQ